MSLTVTEANAVNVVARHVLQVPSDSMLSPLDDDDVHGALAVLLRGANRRLQAGLTPTAAEGWPLRHPVESS